jgi:hypothetical protein
MVDTKWCGCMKVHTFKEGIADLFSRELVDGKLRGEIWELLEVRSLTEFKDEASDIAWGVGRIIGGFLGKAYVRIPGDRIHYNKVVNRINEYGCMRSKRFLVEGKCPNS